MSEKDTVLVAAASYEDVADAEADYEAIKALYYDRGTSHDFDAAVIARDEKGEITVVKKHEQPTRHGAVKGLAWGLAIGAACAIFPAIGLLGGLAVGGVCTRPEPPTDIEAANSTRVHAASWQRVNETLGFAACSPAIRAGARWEGQSHRARTPFYCGVSLGFLRSFP